MDVFHRFDKDKSGARWNLPGEPRIARPQPLQTPGRDFLLLICAQMHSTLTKLDHAGDLDAGELRGALAEFGLQLSLAEARAFIQTVRRC